MKTILLVPRAVRGFLLGGLALLLCSAAQAASYTVNATTDTGAGSGTSGDLRYCVTHAVSGSDTITFASALSGVTIKLGSEFVISSSVTIDGSSLASSVIISGNSLHRIFSVSSGSALTLKVLSLTAGNGSGVSATNNGGAILNQGTLTCTGCTLYSNAASQGGGAIYNTASLTLTNCTLASNTAAFGGGIHNNFGGVTLTHCTVAGNNGTNGTGGIVLSGGVATFRNSIIAGNTAGGGVTDVDIGGSGSGITMTGNNLIGQNGGSYNTGALLTGTPNASGDYVGTNGSAVAANLTTLANHGGPVQTMPPTTSSTFVIDKVTAGNVVSGLNTDERGNARSVDGNSDGTALPDIGAVEFIPTTFLTVSTTQDTGVGSLRQAIANAAQLTGAQNIVFSEGLTGQTITLASTIALNSPAGLTMSIIGLEGSISITISGAGASGSFGLFSNATGSTVTFAGLTLTNGGGSNFGGAGGAIKNLGALTLTQCTLSHNACHFDGPGGGGAIFNAGSLTLTQCTLLGNSSGSTLGGGISNFNTAALSQCTLAANSAAEGGAVGNEGGLMTLTQCTLSGNSALTGGAIVNGDLASATITLTQSTLVGNSVSSDGDNDGEGGAIDNASTLNMANSIIAGNTTDGTGPDIQNSGSITLTGANFIGNTSGTGKSASSTLLTTATKGAINLAPLGSYGGPTPTMPPLVGSAAINAAVGSLVTSDQRGLSVLDTHPDLGATEAIFQQVTNTSASGTGSFTQAITNAALSGHAVSFASNLSGQTITLSGTISLTSGIIIDGGGLTNGVTIKGAGASGSFGLFSNATGNSAFFRGLTLTNGGGSNFTNDGGAIINTGALTLTQCTLSGNVAQGGGAVANYNGTATLTQCTLSGNTTPHGGGAIDNLSVLTLTQCTLSGNSAISTAGGGGIGIGGAIYSQGTTTLTQCTLASNSTGGAGGGEGGGIYIQSGTTTLTNSIVAGNTASSSGPDIENSGGTIAPSGANFIGNLSNTGLSASSTILDTAQNGGINLAALGSYGGPTQTMPPGAGSPAINAAVGSTITTDQRGCPIVGTADLGAAECAIINPSPAQDATITTLVPTFTWAGPAGATFTVTVSTSPTTVVNAGSTSSITLSGALAPNTSYFWQVNATVGGVTFAGPQYAFFTTSLGTTPATTVLSGWATLNGAVNVSGLAGTYFFQYGTSTGYGSTTPVLNLSTSTGTQLASYNINGLTKGTSYHYRLVVVVGGTTYYGADQTFTTPTAASAPTWHSAQITSLTSPNNPMPMADGARTGAAHATSELYFYKGTDGNMWCVYLKGSAWTQAQLTTNTNVSDWLAFEPNYGALCYQSNDGNLWCVYYSTAAAKWVTEQLGTPPQGVTVAGDIVVDSSGGWNNIYYRGSDSHLYAAYLKGSTWTHVSLGGTATVKGNLAVEGNNHLIYYQGTDNNIWCFYYTGKVWEQVQLSTTANVGGTVAVDSAGLLVYYKALTDNSAWCTYPVGGTTWTPVQLDATANMSTSATSFSNIAPYNAAHYNTEYLDNNGQFNAEYYNGSKWGHLLLGDGGSSLTGGLSLQPVNHWFFARRSDGNIIIFYNQ